MNEDTWEQIRSHYLSVPYEERGDLPRGYARSVAAWNSDASICNSGFHECYYHTFEDLLPTYEFWQRLEETRMVQIFESVAVFLRHNFHFELDKQIPQMFPDASEPPVGDTSELDQLYYKEKGSLPYLESTYLTDAVAHYFKTCPEDFANPDRTG